MKFNLGKKIIPTDTISGLRLVVGLLLLSYLIQNISLLFYPEFKQSSWIFTLPVYALLSFFALNSLRFKIGWLILFINAVMFSLYMTGYLRDSNYLDPSLAFDLAGIVATLALGYFSTYIQMSDPIKYTISILIRLITISVFVITNIWAYFILTEQTYSDFGLAENSLSNYLIVADLFVIYGLFSLGNSNFRNALIVLYVSAVLFLLGSRSTMLLGVIILCIAIILKSDIEIKKIIYSIIVFFGFVIFINILSSLFGENIFYRYQNIFNIGYDDSFLGRKEHFQNFVTNINTDVSCLLVPCFPKPGGYVHNILSMIQYYGIFGLVIFIAHNIVIFIAFKKGFRSQLFFVYIFLIISFVLTRSYTSLFGGFVILFGMHSYIWLKNREYFIKNIGV
jgi:hypothetical protein